MGLSPSESVLLGWTVDQLVVTTGYSAGGVILDAALSHASSAYTHSQVFVVSVVGVLALAGSAVTANQPLQKMLFLVASTCVTNALPLSDEPPGFLVAPSVMLYFCAAASGLWALQRISTRHSSPYFSGFTRGLSSFVVAFAAVKAIRRFSDKGHQRLMLYAAVLYIVLFPELDDTYDGTWAKCLVNFLDSFACNGFVTVITSFGPVGAAASGLQLACVYIVVLLALDIFRVGEAVPRAQFCKDTFCFSVGQELLRAMADFAGPPPSLLAFTTSLFVLLYFRGGTCYESTCTVCVAGLSIAFDDVLDRWLLQVACPLERLVVYGAVFALLQQASISQAAITTKDAAHGAAMVAAFMADSDAGLL